MDQIEIETKIEFRRSQSKSRLSLQLRLRTKLLLGFFIIIAINAGAGAFNISVIQKLGGLVNITYDKALMTGNFAQAAKYDFVKVDAEVMRALMARDQVQFKLHADNAARANETLLEDLQVVTERALSDKSSVYVKEITALLKNFESAKSEILALRERELSNQKFEPSPALWNDWAAGAMKAQIEEALTRLYDDAAETGYQFRQDSEKNNQRTLQITIWVVGAGFVLGLLLSTVLSLSLLRPLRILLNACRKIESGDYRTRANIASKDEFGSLSRAFDQMLEKIETRDKEMSSLLSALPFGVFYFGRKGEISQQRSKATDSIFRNFSSLHSIESFFRELKGSKEEDVRETVQMVVDEALPFASAAELLPARLVLATDSEKRFVDLSYHAQRSADEKVERVIVVAEDVTEKTLALGEGARQAERVKRVTTAVRDIAGYREFVPEAVGLFESAESALTNSKMDEAKRDLHSLKGLLGVYDFKEPAQAIHEIENTANAPDASLHQLSIAESLRRTRDQFLAQSDEIAEVLGLKENSSFRLYDSVKIDRLTAAAHRQDSAEVLATLATLDRFPLERVLAKYRPYCDRMLDRLGDKLVQLEFSASSAEISYAEAQRLDSSLVHLLRNCIDHGIETCEARVAAGKNEIGTITFLAERRADGSLYLTIGDDGGGIDAERLAAKAVSNGLWTTEKAQASSDEEKIELIFAAGLSTKTEATDISGRGVGMDAVREQLQSIGARIAIETRKGFGTRFLLDVPEPEPSSLAETSKAA